MPTYRFRCNDTQKLFEVTYKSIADYEAATVKSPFTGSANVTRVIGRVAFKKSGTIGLDTLMSGDESALDALENADPETLGRSLRAMASETGEDMGGDFNEIVSRLESGESPESIESSLPADTSLNDL